MKILDKVKSVSFAQLALYIPLFFVGVFYEYLSAALSVVIILWLTVRAVKREGLKVDVTVTGIAVALLVLSYAVTSLWAVDRGTAIFGFFKFLPLVLYTLVLMQEDNGKEKVICGLPYVITFMAVTSVIGMYIPFVSAYFVVSDRLSGFFQYPNTFALVMLVAELLLLTKEKVRLWDYGCMVVLLFGILSTGSRTVLVLAAFANVAALLINKNKKVRFITLGCIAAGIVITLLYCFITDNFWVLQRYLNISLTESTFVGRLLYASDALPVILKHPFGIGFKGYYYIQQSIQTGSYSVMYIHNDLLQILLDVGWIPALVFVGAMIKTFFARTVSLSHKLVLFVILVHSCFDFDLQYVAVFMMLLLFCENKAIRTCTVARNKGFVIFLSAVLLCLCTYMGTVLCMARFNMYNAVDAIYPASTENDIELLNECEDMAGMESIADRILERNPYVSVAYSAKSRVAYSKGDFGGVIEYKNKAIQYAPYAAAEYREYAYMLINGISLYTQAGDEYSAEVCKKELLTLNSRMREAKENLSEYGKKIDTQPDFYFSTEVWEYIEALEAEQ